LHASWPKLDVKVSTYVARLPEARRESTELRRSSSELSTPCRRTRKEPAASSWSRRQGARRDSRRPPRGPRPTADGRPGSPRPPSGRWR
jgi:hypothetical protein